MLRYKKIRVGSGYIEALSIKLLSKNFILLKGSRGYVMCGYLDLKAAEKFKDVAVKILGVSSIGQALREKFYSCSLSAKRLGIYKGQPVREVLRIVV